MSLIKYVDFQTQHTSGKTVTVDVRSMSANPIRLGTIKWFGAVRSYVFYPEDGVFFTAETMGDITAKITELMDERNAQKAAE